MKTIYYCIGESCNDEVCRKGNRCVSCAQKKWHQEHPNARSGKNSSAYIDGRSLKTYYCTEKDCNKIVCLKGNRCKSHANKLKNLGRKRPDNIIRNKKIFKNCIPWNKNKKLSKLHIKHLKEAHKGIKFSKERKINMSKARVKSWLEPTYRKKLTRERKLRWKNKEYKDNWIKKIRKIKNKRPNKPEKIINKLLQQLLPNKYSYVGNSKVWIENYNPDFISINGQKKIIELFGNYWHANPKKYKASDTMYRWEKASEIWNRDKRRLKTYKKHGYRTLIIWEDELKDMSKVKNKILIFDNE